MELKKNTKNKLKLGIHSIKQSLSSFLSQQILKKNYAKQCKKVLGSCVVDDDQDSWSHNNNAELETCLHVNGSYSGILDHLHAC
jgi:hypothetical protein